MVDNTPRLGLNDYEPGDQNWDHSDLVNAVDERAVERGPVADRPSTGDYDDELYYATDQNILWGWDERIPDWTIRGGKGSSDQPLDSLHTDAAIGRSVSGVSIGPTDDVTIAQKSAFSWDGVNWEHRDTPIIDGSSYSGLAEYASYMPGSVFDSPIDSHYLVWATHDDPAIHLSTASDFWGEWTPQGEVWSDSDTGQETSSPSWVYLPSEGVTRMYYHIGLSGTGQTTRVVEAPTSGDGTAFDDSTKQNVLVPPNPPTWDGTETSYLHVVRDGGSWIGVYQGRDGLGTPTGIAVVHSDDGLDWYRERRPVADGTLDNGDAQIFSPTIVSVGGGKSILFQDRGRGNHVYALPWDRRNKPARNGGVKVLDVANVPWADTGYNIVVEEMFVRDKYLYAIYKSGDDNNTVGSIGVARAPLTEVMA